MFTQRRFVLSSVFIEAYSFMLMAHLKNRSLHTLASTAYLLKLSHCPSNILPIFIVLLTVVTSRVSFTCCHALKTPRTKKKTVLFITKRSSLRTLTAILMSPLFDCLPCLLFSTADSPAPARSTTKETVTENMQLVDQ